MTFTCAGMGIDHGTPRYIRAFDFYWFTVVYKVRAVAAAVGAGGCGVAGVHCFATCASGGGCAQSRLIALNALFLELARLSAWARLIGAPIRIGVWGERSAGISGLVRNAVVFWLVVMPPWFQGKAAD